MVYKFGAAVLFDVSADHTVEADPLLVLLREHKGKAAPDWRSAQAQPAASQAGGQPLHMEGAARSWRHMQSCLLLLLAMLCRASTQGCTAR